MKNGLRTSDVERFREAIAARMGLHFDDSKLDFLADVLERRLEVSRENPAGYAARLEHATTARGELAELARELTVPETYFFGTSTNFGAYFEIALPARLEARGPFGKLAILSAGCASGEEAYSLAILAREHVPDAEARVSVRALDVNPVVLERAARGRYGAWALREAPEELKRRWFTAEGRDLLLDAGVRAAVTFEEVNLAEDAPARWPASTFDVVFFRNVLMYFTPDAARAVIGRLARAMAPGGFLFLGHAENLRGLSHDFHLRHTHDTFYYQRKAELGAPVPAFEAVEPFPRGPADERTEAVLLSAGSSWIEAIQNASDRIRALSEQKHEPEARAERSNGDARVELHAAFELLRSERFGEALARLEHLPAALARDPDVLLLRASLLAHSGDLARAEAISSELVQKDELSAGAHYLLALCREGRGDIEGAKDHDQIATYLDERFAMPRLHLGLLARRAGEREVARRELEQAITLLAREDASRLLLFGGGFGRDSLIALCRAELARLGGA